MRKILVLFYITLVTTLSYGQEISSEYGILEEQLAYIKKESIGGALDFELKIKHDERSFYTYDRTIYSKQDFGIFLWGVAVKKAGIVSTPKAVKLWEEIKKREIKKSEWKALIRGYKSS